MCWAKPCASEMQRCARVMAAGLLDYKQSRQPDVGRRKTLLRSEEPSPSLSPCTLTGSHTQTDTAPQI